MAILKCKMCGGTLKITDGATVAQCDYCGTKQTVPNLSDERKAELFDRANYFRLNNDYDRALRIYEQILRGDETDAEVYWSILLCRYGVEYVEDPATGKRIPTVNRTQRASIFNDPDYQMTLKYADDYQREIYESEAKKIDDIQKGILAISSREDPFDVFICYKETGDDGRRTKDSVLAFDIYKQLTKEGYKVFFARVTLEDKLGTAYEPYIFAALNSAKVMIVVGCKPEHFNAVWVKNEWSRFLAMINAGEKKVLIPAYCDMSPYDLPEEFSYLQAQDMNKIGAIQDLIHGIDKVSGKNEREQKARDRSQNSYTEAGALLKRANLFLEQRDWSNAIQYSNRVLDRDPESFDSYFCVLLAQNQLSNRKEFENYYISGEPIYDTKTLNFAKKFADSENQVWFRDLDAKRNQTLNRIRTQEEEAARLKREEEKRIREEKLAKERRLEQDKKRKRVKRITWITIIVVFIVIAVVIYIIVFSISLKNEYTDIGDGISFEFDKSSATITFSGQGEIKDFPALSKIDHKSIISPFSREHSKLQRFDFEISDVNTVKFEDGITYIGANFCGFPNATAITIPESVTAFGTHAFSDCYSLESIVLPENVESLGDHSFYSNTIVKCYWRIEDWAKKRVYSRGAAYEYKHDDGIVVFSSLGAKEIQCTNGKIVSISLSSEQNSISHYYISYNGTENEWNSFYDQLISDYDLDNDRIAYSSPGRFIHCKVDYVECVDGTIRYE